MKYKTIFFALWVGVVLIAGCGLSAPFASMFGAAP